MYNSNVQHKTVFKISATQHPTLEDQIFSQRCNTKDDALKTKEKLWRSGYGLVTIKFICVEFNQN